jgi:hypothetical protein
MTGRDVVRFQWGAREAITSLAASRATLPTGIVLVLLTSIARNHDQTWIGESPVRWVLGPLLFSLMSGTWLFLTVYALGIRSNWNIELQNRSFWRDWPAFMGLFWMTAPVAWLYAIPVERFLDPIQAARANVALLATVSLWRVLLFARVVQVIGSVRYRDALRWVLMAAAIETAVIIFFATFGEAIMRGMAGLRYSPAQEVLYRALNIAFTGAIGVGAIAIFIELVFGREAPRSRLPVQRGDTLPRWFLAGVTVFWMGVAVLSQPGVRRTAHVEALMNSGQFREALDFLASHPPDQFAPGRPLPPRGYEWSTFTQVPGLVSALQTNDPAWVQDHVIGQLDVLVDSLRSRHGGTAASGTNAFDPDLLNLGRIDAATAQALPGHIARLERGRAWLSNNAAFITALTKHHPPRPSNSFSTNRQTNPSAGPVLQTPLLPTPDPGTPQSP